MTIQDGSHNVLGLWVNTEEPDIIRQAEQLADGLSLPLLVEAPQTLEVGSFVLGLDMDGLSLLGTGQKQAGAVRVDFTSGVADYRRRFGGGKGQMIAKAIGIKGSFKPTVLDLTAGLGQDGFAVACLGCNVTLVERHPLIHALLQDGLARAVETVKQQQDAASIRLFRSIKLFRANALEFLGGFEQDVDVIYLDPMFPARSKSAKVKKAMQAFHHIVGQDGDAGELLRLSLLKATYRVVVKRPRLAPALGEQYPQLGLPKANYSLEGKSGRFDIYTLQKMPTTL